MAANAIPPAQKIYVWVDRMSVGDRNKMNSGDYSPVRDFFSPGNGYPTGYTPTEDEILEVRTVTLDYLGALAMR